MTDAADIVAKSFAALNHDSALSASARGEIMLHLSSLADKVTLAKSDRVDDHVAKVRGALEMLERLKAEHHADQIDPLVQAIKEAVDRGETEPSDLFVIENRLRDIHEKLKDTKHGNQN
jgi:hypothetical protein